MTRYYYHPTLGPYIGDMMPGSEEVSEADFLLLNEQWFGGPSKEPPPDEILQAMRQAIQNHLDAKPKERLYDGILSLCTYATSTNPKFQAEGQAGVEWRDACWAKGYEIMNEVLAGNREIPTVDELLAELPVFHWPDEVTP